MSILFKHEIKTYFKTLLIWVLSVGGIGFFCIILFSSMEDSMKDMAESFSSLGAFSDALGMSKLSIATLEGFYAAEVGTIHALGGAMFAAIISTNMLSKEEDGHTSEFLFSLPVSRVKVITAKWFAIVTHVFLFNLCCVAIYLLGIGILKEEISIQEFLLYHLMQFLMQIVIAAICYVISAFVKKNKLGIGLGVVLLLYAYDMIARVIPDLYDYRIISPFSFANAADILSTGKIEITAAVIGVLLLTASLGTAYIVYNKRDLAS